MVSASCETVEAVYRPRASIRTPSPSGETKLILGVPLALFLAGSEITELRWRLSLQVATIQLRIHGLDTSGANIFLKIFIGIIPFHQ